MSTSQYELMRARALWAVRVLDAWALDGRRCVPQVQPTLCKGPPVSWWLFVTVAGERVGVERATPEAARIAAAEAVYPELPEAVRTMLGKKP